jgi:hypothetical protein
VPVEVVFALDGVVWLLDEDGAVPLGVFAAAPVEVTFGAVGVLLVVVGGVAPAAGMEWVVDPVLALPPHPATSSTTKRALVTWAAHIR